MDRKWTLDRIEFDNETYEITRPAAPVGSRTAPDCDLPTLQLGLTPASVEAAPSARRCPIPSALVVAKTGTDEAAVSTEAGQNRRRYLN